MLNIRYPSTPLVANYIIASVSVSKKVQITKMLRDWRQVQATTENVELYRVLQNNTINLIADELPETNIDLLAIKGLGPKKVQKYGTYILDIVSRAQSPAVTEVQTENDDDSISVSEFLSRINFSLAKHTVRIRGEVHDRVNTRGKAVYFKVKDPKHNAVLECFAWKDTFDDKGTFPKEGVEVILEGQVQIYPPTGRFSLQVKSLELRGEGLLKQAFEKLRRELEIAGAFNQERKRSIETLPRSIAVITATKSDAETDFKTHVGNFGLQIHIYDVRVEGIKSESQIVDVLGKINSSLTQYDCIVITRGGGSIESLQSFNSKKVVEAVMASKYPVISAVGHERDITLCDLVADIRVSTPTDAGKFIGQKYYDLNNKIIVTQQKMGQKAEKIIENATLTIDSLSADIKSDVKNTILQLRSKFGRSTTLLEGQLFALRSISYKLRETSMQLRQSVMSIFDQAARAISYTPVKSRYTQVLNQHKHELSTSTLQLKHVQISHEQHITRTLSKINILEKNITALNPQTVLKRGYAIVSNIDGNTIKNTADIKRSTKPLNLTLQDGTISIKQA